MEKHTGMISISIYESLQPPYCYPPDPMTFSPGPRQSQTGSKGKTSVQAQAPTSACELVWWTASMWRFV